MNATTNTTTATTTTDHVQPPRKKAGLFFPEPSERPKSFMAAVTTGTLFVNDDCIRLGKPHRGQGDVVVFPYGYSLSRKGGETRILNEKAWEMARSRRAKPGQRPRKRGSLRAEEAGAECARAVPGTAMDSRHGKDGPAGINRRSPTFSLFTRLPEIGDPAQPQGVCRVSMCNLQIFAKSF